MFLLCIGGDGRRWWWGTWLDAQGFTTLIVSESDLLIFSNADSSIWRNVFFLLFLNCWEEWVIIGVSFIIRSPRRDVLLLLQLLFLQLAFDVSLSLSSSAVLLLLNQHTDDLATFLRAYLSVVLMMAYRCHRGSLVYKAFITRHQHTKQLTNYRQEGWSAASREIVTRVTKKPSWRPFSAILTTTK